MTSVSVIIPYYRNKKTIKNTLDSVLSQNNVDIEIFIIDDNSNDNLKYTISNYKNIHLITLSKNKGTANARNIALDKCQGEWVQFLDADDTIHSLKLSTQLSNVKNAEVIISDWIEISPDKKKADKKRNIIKTGPANIKQFLTQNPIPIHAPIIKKSLIDKIGHFNPDIFHEDWEFWIRTAAIEPYIQYVPGYFSFYWRRIGSKNYNKARDLSQQINCLNHTRKSKLHNNHLKLLDKSIREKKIRLAIEYSKTGEENKSTNIFRSLQPTLTYYEKIEKFIMTNNKLISIHGKTPGPKKILRIAKKIFYILFYHNR